MSTTLQRRIEKLEQAAAAAAIDPRDRRPALPRAREVLAIFRQCQERSGDPPAELLDALEQSIVSEDVAHAFLVQLGSSLFAGGFYGSTSPA